jgi:hypothetical protein
MSNLEQKQQIVKRLESLIKQVDSFISELVASNEELALDSLGSMLASLTDAANSGYNYVICDNDELEQEEAQESYNEAMTSATRHMMIYELYDQEDNKTKEEYGEILIES